MARYPMTAGKPSRRATQPATAAARRIKPISKTAGAVDSTSPKLTRRVQVHRDVSSGMTFLRVALSIFAILNVVFCAVLAWAWAVKPAWTARLPLRLGTDERFRTAVPAWARLPAAVAGLLALAAGRYLHVDTGAHRAGAHVISATKGTKAGAVETRARVPTAKSPRDEGIAAGSGRSASGAYATAVTSSEAATTPIAGRWGSRRATMIGPTA